MCVLIYLLSFLATAISTDTEITTTTEPGSTETTTATTTDSETATTTATTTDSETTTATTTQTAWYSKYLYGTSK